MTLGWGEMTDHLLFTQLNYKGFDAYHFSIQFRKEETWSRCWIDTTFVSKCKHLCCRLCHCLSSQLSPGQISPLVRDTPMTMTTLPQSSMALPPAPHSPGEADNKTSSTQTSDQSGCPYFLLSFLSLSLIKTFVKDLSRQEQEDRRLMFRVVWTSVAVSQTLTLASVV